MAALACGRCASRNFGLCIYSTQLGRRLLSSKNIYLKKFKHRKDPKISDLDVQEVLYMRGKSDQGSVVMAGGTAQAAEVTSATTTTYNNSWKQSKERLGYLKTSEKRVAVVAVLTMLFGYAGIKWMVSHAPPSKQVEAEEPQSTNEPTIQPAS